MKQNSVIRYRSTIVFKATFKSPENDYVNPDVVELDINDTTYSLANNEIEHVSEGHYQFTWDADVPGKYKRIWVGSTGGTFYAESGVWHFEVAPSNR